jgi:hypothetical protein
MDGEDYRLPVTTAEQAAARMKSAKDYLGATMSISTAKSDIADAQRESYAISSAVRKKQDKQ